nr:uncharacterized protein LOC120963520 [Aegilops tauschii subsp. strangulata]
MASYRFLIQKLSGSFEGCEFPHVPRAKNEAADTLAKIASSRQSIPSDVSLEHLRKPSVKPSPDSESIHVPDDPAAPQPGPGTAEPGPGDAQLDPATIVPDPAVAIPDPGAAQPGSGAADSEPTLVAIFAVERGIDILLDIHQGECGHHAASRSLVAKAFRHGFYWPTTLQDAESLVLKCEGCQRFSKRSHQPTSALRTIPIVWPFAV